MLAKMKRFRTLKRPRSKGPTPLKIRPPITLLVGQPPISARHLVLNCASQLIGKKIWAYDNVQRGVQ